MKICIVTVYNSLNYGSYLQAFALNQVLNEFGGEVSFLDTKARNPGIQTLSLTTRKIISFKFSYAYFQTVKYASFKKAIKRFAICSNSETSLKEQDVFVFGSDEIWNISRKEFRDYPIFLGVGLPNSYLVSYAVSINTTKLEQIKGNKFFINALERFSKLSVRDSYTLDTLKVVTTKNIKHVLDPTFLLSKDVYKELEEECFEKNYILVYSYGNNLNHKKINKIKLFAESKKMRLISVGFYLEWCDQSVPASPFLFLSYIKNASFIITDTFHGTVFSIIYNKAFVSYGGCNRKISEILNQFGLGDRNVEDDTVLESVLETTINYKKVNNLIESYKDDSFEYISSFTESLETRRHNRTSVK